MLTLPLALAALTAGVAGGVHCIGMCGGISMMLSRAGKKIFPILPSDKMTGCQSHQSDVNWAYQLQLHAGRIFTYMLIGAMIGAMGNLGLMFKPYLPVHRILFWMGNLALILLGLRVLGIGSYFHGIASKLATWQQLFFSRIPALRQKSKYPFLIGMGWGCLPCGLLYGVAPFALFAGDPLSGALLMWIFGMSALPHLILGQGIFNYSGAAKAPVLFKYAGSFLLIAIGIAGLWYSDMKNMPDFLCILPAP